MIVDTYRFDVASQGNSQVIDLSAEVAHGLEQVGIRDGVVTLFVVGSTAALTTTEFEPGLATHDLKAFFDRIIPENGLYKHEEMWHDDNGHSHLRASLLGPSITVPLVDGRLTLGTWQQIILIDFDTRPRQRTIIMQCLGRPAESRS